MKAIKAAVAKLEQERLAELAKVVATTPVVAPTSPVMGTCAYVHAVMCMCGVCVCEYVVLTSGNSRLRGSLQERYRQHTTSNGAQTADEHTTNNKNHINNSNSKYTNYLSCKWKHIISCHTTK